MSDEGGLLGRGDPVEVGRFGGQDVLAAGSDVLAADAEPPWLKGDPGFFDADPWDVLLPEC